MKISVFGVGYVGLVTGVCFAEMGNDVICVDIDEQKIAKLRKAQSPIFEPGLEEMLKSNIKAGRLHFTTSADEAIDFSDMLFVAVGTPPAEDGSADLRYVLDVVDEIAKKMTGYKLVVTKSTVPIGTSRRIKDLVFKKLRSRGLEIGFDVASNPEFLREGCAIEDCLSPSRVVVGVESDKAAQLLKELYKPFLKDDNQFFVMEPASSEMTKYAANAMLATKISLMNELSRVCEKLGANIESVRRGIGSDFRIGPHFIYAGIGYGGSCFPKDVSALTQIGFTVDEEMKILISVDETNKIQRERYFKKTLQLAGGSLNHKKVAVWGVAFKPGTDDIREAPAIDLIDFLLRHGAVVTAFDPVASENASAYFKDNPNLIFKSDQYAVLDGVELLCIATEWKSFKEPNFELMRAKMSKPLVYDGRNIYNPEHLRDIGFDYYSIGR